MDTRDTILRRWSGEIPVFVATLALFALCAALLASRGIVLDAGPVLANAHIYLFSIVAWVAVDAACYLARHRPQEPFAALHRRYAGPAAIRRWIAGAPLLALCILLMPFFSKMKAAIPLFNAYTWDATFIAWDRAIFFGYDAWQVLQPLFGYPPVTALLGLLYQLWFLLLYVGCLYMAFAAIDPGLRRRFFLSYTLSWSVIGGGAATLLASVGPCFLGPLLGDPAFDAQMAYLHAADAQIPVMPLAVQQMLLDWHHNDANGLGSGITAMPSMHVAIAFLFWLAVRRISPRAGRWMFAFFVLTWIGSVHLAYHYAVDGLVSVVLVAALWRISGAAIAWWDNRLAHTARQIHPALRTKTVPAE
ncbi:phosphatase PAP2 family protein [Pelagerythrobacter marensis]|uniref:Phosphatase PAP2 family protein n=1 Tax=Pelagerythrobacter marensis TaxID=543877 RepID=A0ABZ2D1Q0_9SPHN